MKIARIHFSVIDSTNTWSKHQAHTFPHDCITLVTADEQTAGRGRFNRRWESPRKQNIYATYNFFIEKHRNDIGNIPQIMALAGVEMLEKMDIKAFLKWPNDILLSGKKVGGILCETTPFSDTLCIILGIGINVNMPLEILNKIDRPATSLFAETGSEYEMENVLENLTLSFQKLLELFVEDGFYPFYDQYVSKLAHRKGDLIRFHDNRIVHEGTFHSINPDGSLNLQLASGEIRQFIAGEIIPESK